MALACPACRAEMEPLSYLGVSLDVCPECAGIWFDDTELSAVQKVAPDALTALEEMFEPELAVQGGAEKMKKCPRDETRLDTYHYAYDTPVKIDSCPKCHGIFVEDLELAGIHEAINSENRARFTQAMEAHHQASGAATEAKNVSALIHALHHWREQTVSK
jgi:Zn-finger nucleic acid-binding protein